MKNKQTTINDLARELGVTPSTISRALNDHSRISDATKKKVRELAKKMNYRPNIIASSLRRGRGSTIGVIVPQINRYFFANVIHSIEEVLNKKGYNLLICQSNETLEREKLNVKTLLDSRVDGIIMSLSSQTNDYHHLQQILDANTPLVQFDRVAMDVETSYVVNDNYDMAYEAVKHLIDQGYTKIAHLAGPTTLSIFSERMKAYRDALKNHGLDFNPLYMQEAIIEATGTKAAKELLTMDDRPDAFFCSGDYSALGVMNVALDMGLNVPKDLGIVGFANEPFTTMVRPQISSVDQHSSDLGTQAAKLMVDHVESEEEIIKTETHRFRGELIIRESSLRKE
ncbi:LacI family DNA-binding transcriptional regulator [Marinoscillum sp. MHG1-6]|uniref:LacI family DNA-binding transcriptional regulator n=1 Tax=Marinoscillum sp. MHG1-6 TaxID=2959627 RepID=UPI002157E97A|nr:LacI family DNA-binding transcriptional regulator [Marinoscillum sp. MHG1-6]